MFSRMSEWLRGHRLIGGISASVLALVVYARSLPGGFVYLDEYQVIANPLVTRSSMWPRIFTGAIWSFLGGPAGYYYRPLHYFSYWIVYRLAGPKPAAFHFVQLAVYAATVWIVYRVARELFDDQLTALGGALLWALHPLHVEPVASIAALPEVGCGFFYLLAFWFFLRLEKSGRRAVAWHGLAAAAYLPALFFKEMAVTFPLVLLAYWFFVSRRESWLGCVVRWIPYLLAVGLYVAARRSVLGHLTANPVLGNLSLPVFMASAKLLGEYTRLFFWPTHLNNFRVVDLRSLSLWPFLTFLGLGGGFWVRKREPVFSFLIFWWPATLLPCLDIRQLTFPLVADRLAYLPSVGLCLALSFLLLRWLPERVPRLQAAWLVPSTVGLLMFSWALQTVRTIPHWHDNETLVNYSLRESPGVAQLHALKGGVLASRDGEGATREYETALRLNATSERQMAVVDYESYLALGRIAWEKGQADEAVSCFEKAIAVPVHYSIAYDHLAAVYISQGNYAKATGALADAVKVNPHDLEARFNLGLCWMKLGKYRQAAEQFRAVREADPGFPHIEEAEEQATEAADDTEGETVGGGRSRVEGR